MYGLKQYLKLLAIIFTVVAIAYYGLAITYNIGFVDKTVQNNYENYNIVSVSQVRLKRTYTIHNKSTDDKKDIILKIDSIIYPFYHQTEG